MLLDALSSDLVFNPQTAGITVRDQCKAHTEEFATEMYGLDIAVACRAPCFDTK